MSYRKVANWTIGICFVAANILGIGLSHHRRSSDASMQRHLRELQGLQAKRIAAWEAADPLSLESNACTEAIRQLAPAEELASPVAARELQWDDLPASEANDLAKAVRGLMRVYRRGGAEHLINYMDSREESLTEENVQKLRNYLVTKHGFNDDELKQRSLEEQFSMFWDIYGVTPNWKAFVPEQSGIRIWQSHSATPESISEPEQLSESDTNLWQHRAEMRHNFTNEVDTLSSQISNQGEVKFADVRLIIQHDGKSVHKTCPYVVRFWYSAERAKWVPHLLAQYRTSSDISSELLF